MKLRVVLVVLSLTADLVLAVLWARRAAASHLPSPEAQSTATVISQSRKGIRFDAGAWKTISTPDDAVFVAQLRDEGFPPEIVYALVRERVKERFADRQRALRSASPIPYWRRSAISIFNNSDPATRAAQRQLDREITDAVKALLGPDADYATPYERADRQRFYGNLSSEKVDQIKSIDRDYGELRAQISDTAKGVILREDREKLAFLDAERRADLAKLLTPDELAEYDLRSSPAANEVRYRLTFFQPTEEEFRALAKLQLDFNARYGLANLTQEQQERRNNAESEHMAQIRATLGADRFAQYEIATDTSYRTVDRIVQMAKLPSETTGRVIMAQRELQRRAETIRKDSALSVETRNQQLLALSDEATLRLRTMLGPEAFVDYERNGWLQRLKPPTPPKR